MREKFIVEGANFVATVIFDTESFLEPYTEAATRTVENIFRHGPDAELSGDFDLLIKENEYPDFGIVLSVVKDGDIGNDSKVEWVSTMEVAKNAGCLELVRYFQRQGIA